MHAHAISITHYVQILRPFVIGGSVAALAVVSIWKFSGHLGDLVGWLLSKHFPNLKLIPARKARKAARVDATKQELHTAFEECGINEPNEPPQLVAEHVQHHADGSYDATLNLRRGATLDKLPKIAGVLETHLPEPVVEVRRHPQHSSKGLLHVSPVDHWQEFTKTPVLWTPRLLGKSIWDGVAIGPDERGRVLKLVLPGKNLGMAAQTGGGKSEMAGIILIGCAEDEHVRFHISDPKNSDGAPWAERADTFETEIDGAIEQLENLVGIMKTRQQLLTKHKQFKITRAFVEHHGWPLHLYYADELADYTLHGDRAKRTKYTELLGQLYRKGRAPGVIPFVITQQADANVVPTQIRSNIVYRIALKCGSTSSSDMILGNGMSRHQDHPADAYLLPADKPGCAYVRTNDDRPARIRGFHVEDDDRFALAEKYGREWQARKAA